MFFKDRKSFDVKKYGLAFLNLTQFSVVLVDNIFKLIIAFFLIDIGGKDSASQILAAVGAVYVTPFLLLSSLGGNLADRFSKRTITIFIKCMGGAILLAALYIFYIKSAFGCYCLLFLLSMQSAIFGPSKYGLISELVPHQDISKANGTITSFTYLAIILGTFLGSFLSDFFNKNYFLVLLITLVFSIIGIIASFLIPKTEHLISNRNAPSGIFTETFTVISHYPKKAHLGIAMLANAFFLLIGGFTQLGIIPFAINILKQTEFIGGYLFLTTALGIALGSYLVGKLSKNGPNLMFTSLGGFTLVLMLLILGLFITSIKGAILCLVILGIAGGFYIVPIDAFIQLTAFSEHRGRILGLNNLLGFSGVLMASLLLYLLSHVLNIKIDYAFAIIGIINLIFMVLFISKLSDKLLAYWLGSRFFKKTPLTIIPTDLQLLVLPKINFFNLSSLIASKKRIRFISDKKHFLNPSLYLYLKPNRDIASVINLELDEDELLIMAKSEIKFDLSQIEGKVGEIEEKIFKSI
jgi:acyl-[acyl-carrier-protein]-phospholipid O-acyltransferase/long-chain-fatty-acid--[acyl-carrier-protein] ligase